MRGFGVFVAAFMGGAIIAGLISLAVIARDTRSTDCGYEDCVRNIPAYVDAQEALYQEQECKQGWAP